MYRVTLICDDVPKEVGAEAALDITNAFTLRPWHNRATCSWDGSSLILVVENDFDFNGLATQDEFSDEICANMQAFDGDMRLESVVEF